MPEWQQIVRERLGALRIAPEREDEVVAELAGHFEDAYEGWLESGAMPEHALARAFSEVTSWRRLRKEIHHATQEDPMNERTKNLWLPGMVMLFLSSVLLMFITRFGPFPKMVWIDPRQPVVFYVPWLISLPFFGALGAYWSRRVGGSLRQRTIAGLFPAASLVATFALFFPLGFIVDWHIPVKVKLISFTLYILSWVLISGAALLLGALPFLRNHSNESTHARM